jgi:tetratricopeptide (TPR) repeat protein
MCSVHPGRFFLSTVVYLLLLILLPTTVGGSVRTDSDPDTIHEIRNSLAAVRSLRTPEERLAEALRIEGMIRGHLEVTPDDPDLLWWAIAAMGVQVDNESSRGKIDRTREIHAETERLRILAPDHPGGEHAMGRLHAGVMRLNRVLRFLAVRLIGGDHLRRASWEEAEAHFRRAVELDPRGLHHRFELATLLMDRGQREEARTILQELADGSPSEARMEDDLDALHRVRARELLNTLQGR